MILLLSTIPLIPDGDEARRWAEQELARPEYAEARPTPFDEAARAVIEAIGRLLEPGSTAGLGPIGLILVSGVVVAVLVVALIVWGRPRRSRSCPSANELLGEDDSRTSAQLRADAERSARAGDWGEAIVLRYRAVARSLVERDVVAAAPGATAQRIAREAADAFPWLASGLTDAAATFDDVRYLRRPGTEARYRGVVEVDAAMQSARPEFAPPSRREPVYS